MNSFEEILSQTAAEAWREPDPEDYTGPDGLLYCGKCRTRKQCRVTFGGRERVVGCLCRCAARLLSAVRGGRLLCLHRAAAAVRVNRYKNISRQFCRAFCCFFANRLEIIVVL